MRKIGYKNLMASKVDKHTDKVTVKTVGEKKRLNVFMRNFQMLNVRNFYSDSLSDTLLAELADKAMIIRGNELIEWNEYKPSKLKMFLSREFLSFLIVGGINTVSNAQFFQQYIHCLFQIPHWHFSRIYNVKCGVVLLNSKHILKNVWDLLSL